MSAEQLLLDALTLGPKARADLRDRLVGTSAEAIPAEIEDAHLQEVSHRLARVEPGQVQLIPGEVALARGRELLAQFSGERARPR